MSKFGYEIRNIEAGSLYYYNMGLRKSYDCTVGMLSNSLLRDYLNTAGLEAWRNEATLDVICLEFSYGTRSYEEEHGHIERLIQQLKELEDFSEDEKAARLEKYNELLAFTEANKDRYVKISKEELRTIYYTHGVDITYPGYKKQERRPDLDRTIHYRMLYRSPGKAKKGSCIFINEKLYDGALKFIRMGIDLPEKNAPIVEIGAYSSLVGSSIIDKIQILPKNILVLKDFDSAMRTNVVSVETDKENHCRAVRRKNYEVKNTLFDGQALIDSSIFPSWANGYVLLRHHFCKMAAFNSNIQLFFQDYFGEEYDTAVLTDMFGNKHMAKDIKLITTNNAMKWLKFGVSYDYWIDRIAQNGYMFGVVKTAHKSKLGDLQRMSYQMVNSLDMDGLEDVFQDSLDYVYRLKSDDAFFLDYLRDNASFVNDYEPLVALCEQDPTFIDCDYFRERRRTITYTYMAQVRSGKVLEKGDNLVIVGSPYAMLLHSVGEDPETDDTFAVEKDSIQCFTERFDEGEYLAAFRSPFNGRGNMGALHNIRHPKLDRYFSLGEQIIAVNLVHTDFQARNNGSDQDSDTIYCTNHPQIAEFARYCYTHYPTIVNNIPMETNHYDNTLENFAKIDNTLAKAQRNIGESSNLAQLCLTYTYNFKARKYEDYVCILSVIAQASIDSAKRTYSIDIGAEIARIRADMNIKKHGYPLFWEVIKKEDIKREKLNTELMCPMNRLLALKAPMYRHPTPAVPLSEYFIRFKLSGHRRKSMRVERWIQEFGIDAKMEKANLGRFTVPWEETYLQQDFDNLVAAIRSTYFSSQYIGLMAWLLDRSLGISNRVRAKIKDSQAATNKNRVVMMSVLYSVNKSSFLRCFSRRVSNMSH